MRLKLLREVLLFSVFLVLGEETESKNDERTFWGFPAES